jgi:hypothetical protein
MCLSVSPGRSEPSPLARSSPAGRLSAQWACKRWSGLAALRGSPRLEALSASYGLYRPREEHRRKLWGEFVRRPRPSPGRGSTRLCRSWRRPTGTAA